MKYTFCILLVVASLSGFSQHKILGKWKTIDENSGEVKSIVEIFERSNKVYGKIIKIFPKPGADPDPVCNKCDEEDARYKRKIIGMEIIQNMVKDGDEYGDGDILDPQSGKIYSCKIWLEGDDLKVRGYWGLLFRTQTWKRAP